MKLTFPSALFLLFLFLKLTDKIDWSWWWVTSPLWIGLPIILLIMFSVLIGAFFVAVFSK